MAQIVTKLNLNKTPSTVENNSLIFAKNIRLDVDGSIHRDYGIFPMSLIKNKTLDKYINYKNILSRIISDAKTNASGTNASDYYVTLYNRLMWISGNTIKDNSGTTIASKGEHQIVGIIPNSNDFYIFIHGEYKDASSNTKYVDIIVRYDEKEDKFYPCNCNWNWSGGTIHGCIVTNLIGETILNIGETGTDKLVPFKSINIDKASINDDESIYTQIPNIPITNLTYAGDFSCIIPNGVYQFFVRYRIRKDFYTNWFPASSEIFVGNKNSIITSFGTLSYTNIHRDSDNSFVLAAEHLLNNNSTQNNTTNYDSYQIGFILSHDDAVYARAWKHFNFNVTNINFDYKAEDSEEIEVIDLLRSTYGLYNVGNITSFKNKLYISNYIESDFNENLQSYADAIRIELKQKTGEDTYSGYPILTSNIQHKEVISGLRINGVDRLFTGTDGIFKEIMNTSTSIGNKTIEEAIRAALNNSTDSLYSSAPDLYNIRVVCRIDTLTSAKNKVINKYKDISNNNYRQTNVINFGSDTIQDVTVNGASKSIDANTIISYIYSINRYLNKNCKWINSSGTLDDTITIKIKRNATVTQTTTYYNSVGGDISPYDPSDNIIDDSIGGGGDDSGINRPSSGINTGTIQTVTNVYSVDYYQTIELTHVAWATQYSVTNAITLINNTTLIPYQKYKFYIHFVKATGETTNGYECKGAGELEAPYMEACSSVIYPKFNNIVIPDGYIACFFSIVHTKVNSATIFNINNDSSNNNKEGTCFDINMMLIPGNKEIHIKQGKRTINTPVLPDNPIIPTISETSGSQLDEGVSTTSTTVVEIETYSGQYYNSSDASSSKYFGADGVITFDKTNIDDNKLAYAITDYSISETENIDLIKCTPYLNASNLDKISSSEIGNIYGTYSFEDYTKMNLLGYICNITPLVRERCIRYYNDGSSVYYKDFNSNSDNPGLYIYFDELNKYIDANADKKLSNFSLITSNNKLIYSNYNLNYVTLSEEPKMVIKTYYNRAANSTSSATESEENDSSTILLRLIPSQLMSDVYTLPSMYKSYTRKIYSKYTENDNIIFNNTVRSSILYGDENQINVLTFDANDYYNIPTNRGVIVNLIAVGDAILVHTKDSMFKFSGSNTIQSSDGELQIPESKPFDTGVSEVFGSDFGFAGLQDKNDHIVTENGYIFFDRDSRIVYLYSGQGQIIKISDSIEKLFRHRLIDNISFANDYYNNRFFMSIMFYENYVETENGNDVLKQKYYPVTLSFSTIEDIKSFVSLHDFYYHYSFNTKTNCYFLTSDNKDICIINKEHKGCYTKLELTSDKIYPQRKETVYIKSDLYDSVSKKYYNIKSYDSIIDIIENSNYENIKTLNAVNWCGFKVDTEFKNIDDNDVTSLLMADDVTQEIPCKYIRIYTDTCATKLCACIPKANDSSITSASSYKYPFYNQGIWTFNYFRNILNSKNHVTNYSGDNNSLIEGKYFVIRFIFDSDFKFETLYLNYDIKQ